MNRTGLTAFLALCGCAGAIDLPAFRAEALPDQSVVPSSVNWGDGLDLQEALALALANHPRQRVARVDLSLARAQRVTAGTFAYNPQLSVEGGRGTSSFAGPDDYSVKVGISQTFETGGQRARRISIAERNIERARWTVADAQRLLRGQTTTSFYEILFFQRRLQIASQNAELAARLLQAAEARFGARQIPEVDLNLVRAEHQQALLERERASRELQAARARLALLVGEPNRTEFEAKGDLPLALAIVDKERLYQIARERRPDLRALVAQITVAQQRIELVRASVWPDLTVGISGERQVSQIPTGAGDLSKADNLFAIGVSIPIPIFNTRRGEILEAEAEQERARAEQSVLELEVRRDIELGINRLGLAKATLDAYENQLNKLSKQNLEDVERAYKAGEVGTLELLRAQENFNRAALNYLGAQFELRIALTELETGAGAKISEMK